MEKVVILGFSSTILGLLIYNYFQNKSLLSAIVFIITLVSLIGLYLIRFNQNTKDVFFVKGNLYQLFTLLVTCILAAAAVYTAQISAKVSKINAEDYANKMKVHLLSRVLEIPKKQDRYKVKVLIKNSSDTSTNIENIEVIVIDLQKYLNDHVIDSLKTVNINFEKLYLPPNGETTYSFNFHEKELKKLINDSIAFLSAIRYIDYNNEPRVLNIIYKVGKMDKASLGVYRSWVEDFH